MNEFENALLCYVNEETLLKIQSVKIGIAGTGGLGSNCAFNLVRTGFKDFIAADFDVVEYKNLNRQFFFIDQVGMPKVVALETNLRMINPDIRFQGIQTRITENTIDSIFSSCDVIVEAFDKVEYKKMIIEKYAQSEKLLVSASGLAGYGDSDRIRVREIGRSFFLIGDGTSGVSGAVPPLSPCVNIAAAKEADCILNWVIRRK